MTQINCIRVLRQQVGLPVARVAELMAVSWQTAKKYGDADELPPVGTGKARKKPVMDGYLEVIEAWLLEDLNKPAKQRRTAKKLHEGLQALGCRASARTVRHYVRRIKQRLRQQAERQFVRLEHAPGEAQVDFGVAKLLLKQAAGSVQLTERSLLVVSFPYSNAQFCRLLPAQNAECLFHGLNSIFEELGGVPPLQVFDNLSPAIRAILERDQRTKTEAFERFQWHYRFEARFCTPGQGNEKGHVENKVGYVRRNFLTPLPVVREGELPRLEARLRRDLEEDLNREHYQKGRTLKELWAEEQAVLLTLPTQPFAAARLETAVTNRYSEFRLDGEVYHAPWAAPGQRLLVRVYWDRLEVLDETGAVVLGTTPRRYLFRAEEVDWAAELRIFVHQPRAVEQATNLKSLPEPVRRHLLEAPLAERPRRIQALIELFERGQSLPQVTALITRALRLGRTDVSALQVLSGYARRPLTEPHTPAVVRNWQPDLGRYDLLAAGGANHA